MNSFFFAILITWPVFITNTNHSWNLTFAYIVELRNSSKVRWVERTRSDLWTELWKTDNYDLWTKNRYAMAIVLPRLFDATMWMILLTFVSGAIEQVYNKFVMHAAIGKQTIAVGRRCRGNDPCQEKLLMQRASRETRRIARHCLIEDEQDNGTPRSDRRSANFQVMWVIDCNWHDSDVFFSMFRYAANSIIRVIVLTLSASFDSFFYLFDLFFFCLFFFCKDDNWDGNYFSSNETNLFVIWMLEL